VITTLSILLVVPSGRYTFTVTSFKVWPQLYLSVLPPFEEFGNWPFPASSSSPFFSSEGSDFFSTGIPAFFACSSSSI
jgi:hypothetical protein